MSNETEIFDLLHALFPICRSLTGDGVRRSLALLQKYIPLKVVEVPTGERCFDWVVPNEWNIRDAYVKNEHGERVIDFQKSNLHLVGYSIPFRGKMTLAELKPHLHTLPEQPNAIPYVTSYYQPRWGFCVKHSDFLKLTSQTYEVCVDSTLAPGYLSYGELLIPGQSKNEVLLSTYLCHPSLANNELSGPIVTTFLARALLAKKNRFTYRVLFLPETLGPIVYLSGHLEQMKANTIAGYVVTCVGDGGPFSYLASRSETAMVDRVTQHVLRHSEQPFHLFDFLARGSDERQYCAPGIDLPVGSLMRTRYGDYPEYHTSLDNLSYVSPTAMLESIECYLKCLEVLEKNRTYRATVLGEPQLGKRGLYPTLSTKDSLEKVRLILDILAYADGRNDLIQIAEKIKVPVWKCFETVDKLLTAELLKEM